jgi:hypothetical protein
MRERTKFRAEQTVPKIRAGPFDDSKADLARKRQVVPRHALPHVLTCY